MFFDCCMLVCWIFFKRIIDGEKNMRMCIDRYSLYIDIDMDINDIDIDICFLFEGIFFFC